MLVALAPPASGSATITFPSYYYGARVAVAVSRFSGPGPGGDPAAAAPGSLAYARLTLYPTIHGLWLSRVSTWTSHHCPTVIVRGQAERGIHPNLEHVSSELKPEYRLSNSFFTDTKASREIGVFIHNP
jgi:hypothetical protein